MAGGWGNSSRFVFIGYCSLAVEVAFIFLVISRLSLTMIFAGRLLSMAISVLGSGSFMAGIAPRSVFSMNIRSHLIQ